MTNTIAIKPVEIIERFGGITKLSRALGHPHPTTVQGWKQTGKIPKWRMPEITAAASQEGIEISDLIGDC